MLRRQTPLRPCTAAVGAALLCAALPTQAANWLMLQGTESPKAPQHRFWGFVQPAYTSNRGDPVSGLSFPGLIPRAEGKYIAQNLVAPDLNDTEAFHVRRARFGARGRFTDKINYFGLLEVANNGLTYDPFGDRARAVALSDLSVTFNQVPGARVRLGLFKNPGSEELLQAIHVFDYIDFTDFTARVNLERFVTGAQAPAASAQLPGMGTGTAEGYGFSAARDWGLQVFDSFKQGNWDLSYAVKVGRGEAISTTEDNNFEPEWYLYGAAEYGLPGGKGPNKNGVKLYAWRQQGKRDFETAGNDDQYDRIRQGIGFKALGHLFGSRFKHRISGELMFADGMIFTAPQGNVAAPGNNLQYAVEKGNKARGYYLDYGFYLDQHWQFDVRWDRDELLYDTAGTVDPGNEREITAWTFGVNYHFNPKVRLTLNYTAREAKAPTAYPNAALTRDVRKIVDTLDDRIAAQLTWIF